ncbi:hypothetical protein ACP70R_010157 [Stipagrostis hirtigluma subsp. patula]
MVKFGKKLMADQEEEWKRYYINYKLLKKLLKQYVQQTQHSSKNYEQIRMEISTVLDDQIEKIVLFLLQQQGCLARRIEELGKQRTALLRQYDISQAFQLCEAYREIGRDLIRLLRFTDMNATGIRKILKKFDKRFSYKFTDYYVSTRTNHPYSQLQQVFKQVGIIALTGALSCNLAYLEDYQGSMLSIYDQPSIELRRGVPIAAVAEACGAMLRHLDLGNNCFAEVEELAPLAGLQAFRPHAVNQAAYLCPPSSSSLNPRIGFYISVPGKLRWPVLEIAILAAVV